MSAQGVVIHKSYNPAENIGEQLRTSENINNWGPIIDNLVQFEEDFNSWNDELTLIKSAIPVSGETLTFF